MNQDIHFINCALIDGDTITLIRPSCPHCQAELQSPRPHVTSGENGRCPACKGRFQVSEKGQLLVREAGA